MTVYPKTLESNLSFRKLTKEKCEKDWKLRQDLRGYCSHDILFWFNIFAWTQDTRLRFGHPDPYYRGNPDQPFITYPYQDEFILDIQKGIEEGEDRVVEKSRDMGITWMVLLIFQWNWQFREGQFLVGSRKQESVDTSGVMSTLFEKMRYSLQKQPKFLMPKGFDFKKHSLFMRILNPENRNSISGEATNPNFSVSGRYNAIFFDEFAKWEENANEAWEKADQSSPCRIAGSTPEGLGNKFAELINHPELQGIRRTIHWPLHPKKSQGLYYVNQYSAGKRYNEGMARSVWYDKEILGKDPSWVAQELDLDYAKSGNPVFDLTVVQKRKIECVAPIGIGDLEWKVSPEFDKDGNCINDDKLKVEYVENPNGKWKIWTFPEKNKWKNQYCISADCSEGLEGHNFSSSSVRDRDFDPKSSRRPQTVATLHGLFDADTYAVELAKAGTFYNNAWVAIERNNHGHSVILAIFRIYRWLYHKDVYTKGIPQSTDKIGWDTYENTKKLMIDELKRQIREDQFFDPEMDFWRECETFVYSGRRMEAQGKSSGGKLQDDRVIDRALNAFTSLSYPEIDKSVKDDLYDWRDDRKKLYASPSWVNFV